MTLRLSRALPGAVVLFFTLCCTVNPNEDTDAFEGESLYTAEVDCVGMFFSPVIQALGRRSISHTWAYDIANDKTLARCEFNYAPGSEGAQTLDLMRSDDLLTAMTTDAPYANITIRVGGGEYNSYNGTLQFDSFEEGKASGTYEARGLNLADNINEQNANAIISGRFDWCDVRRTDCEHVAETTGFDKEFEVVAPVATGSGGTLDCRILHDATNETIQVDMQMGTWNNINVSEYMLDACWDFGGVEPQVNYFSMRAGGVPGPGTYDLGSRRTIRYVPTEISYGVATYDEVRLQYFDWAHPAVFQDSLPSYEICDAFLRQSHVTPPADGGGCSYTVNDGTFSLDCDEVVQNGMGFAGQGTETGAFHLETDCDWVTL